MISNVIRTCFPVAALVAHISADAQIERVEVAGPGFVNFYLSTAAGNEIFNTVREQGADFGRSAFGAGQKVQVEYVSANPVGPLHIGHGRWAALGDSLSRILAFAGYDECAEDQQGLQKRTLPEPSDQRQRKNVQNLHPARERYQRD